MERQVSRDLPPTHLARHGQRTWRDSDNFFAEGHPNPSDCNENLRSEPADKPEGQEWRWIFEHAPNRHDSAERPAYTPDGQEHQRPPEARRTNVDFGPQGTVNGRRTGSDAPGHQRLLKVRPTLQVAFVRMSG